jgi:hypothetical protein
MVNNLSSEMETLQQNEQTDDLYWTLSQPWQTVKWWNAMIHFLHPTI